MKIKILILILSLVCLANEVECRSLSSWFPQSFVDTVTNTTSQLTDYVRDTGRSLKQFYVDNVKNKISSYFDVRNKTKIARQTRRLSPDTAGNKFNEYIKEAERNGKKIFDVLNPPSNIQCKKDPTVPMTTPQLIALHGYPAESHTILTDDGYVLTIHRIPHSNKGPHTVLNKTVLLHHGLLGSSADWIIPGPGKGLAYILSDAGYDIWLANARGNTYSRAHVSRPVNSFAFWNFTFHDISQHDLPAVIDYIKLLKGSDIKLNYVGHSMGTTVLFALLSTKPIYNKVLRAAFALAPVAYMSDIRSPIRILARYADNLEYLLKILGANEFLPQNSFLRWLSKYACEINHYEEVICENSMFLLCGYDAQQFNRTLLPLILGHMPAGASTKTLVHYAQEIRNKGRFQQFDYGKEGNKKQYGTEYPPEYPLSNITLPIALFSSENDWLAGEPDVNNLYIKLPNPIEHYVVPLKEFNHIDFILAIDAPKLVYKRLLQLMESDLRLQQFSYRNKYNKAALFS